MSGTLTLAAGQVFTGGSTVGTLDTGQVAFTQTGTVTFNTSVTPITLAEVVITKDVLGSSQTFNGGMLDSVTITSVTPNSTVELTTADLPPGIAVPPGFTLPQTDTGTVIGVTANTNFGPLTGTAGIIAVDGPLVLVGDIQIMAFGETLNAGAAVLSLGTQTTGDGLNEVFTPVVTPPACFASGTHIETREGEVLVESLREGQHVATASDGSTPVMWLGRRSVDCRQYPRPQDVWPVRIGAGAFGPAQPRRDLVLSPDHAVFVDGALIPVRYLVNGVTIRQQEVNEVTYWHVELARHELLLAEGLACESYLDTGNRAAFEDGSTAAVAVASV
jgi:collagen type I/II/III/V/XI/XXIV/XXVII alpha